MAATTHNSENVNFTPRVLSWTNAGSALATLCGPEMRLKLVEKARSIAEQHKPSDTTTMVNIFGAMGSAYHANGELTGHLDISRRLLGSNTTVVVAAYRVH
jgi:hypothetical protein